jgi:hypothetical protein
MGLHAAATEPVVSAGARHPFRCASGRFGYVNDELKPVISCEYDEVKPFVNGLGAVRKGGLWGAVDDQGNLRVALEHQNLDLLPFNGGVIMISGKAYNAWYRVWQWRVLPRWNILSPGSSSPLLATSVPRTVWSVRVVGGPRLMRINHGNHLDSETSGPAEPETLPFTPATITASNHLLYVTEAELPEGRQMTIYRSGERRGTIQKVATIQKVWRVLADGSLLLAGESGHFNLVSLLPSTNGHYQLSGPVAFTRAEEDESQGLHPIMVLLKKTASPGETYMLYDDRFAWGKAPAPLIGRLLPCSKSDEGMMLEPDHLDATVFTTTGSKSLGHLSCGFLLRAAISREAAASSRRPVIEIPDGTNVDAANRFEPAYSHPLLILRKEGKYGLWNVETHALVLPFDLDGLSRITEGIYQFKTRRGDSTEYGLIRADGTRLTPRTYFDIHNWYGSDYVKVRVRNTTANTYESFYVQIRTGVELREQPQR